VGAAITSSVFQENVGKLELQVIKLGKQLIIEYEVNDAKILNLVPPANCPILKAMTLNFNACFGST
jgi:hypothetical protein